MAIYRFSAQMISRSAGRSCVAAAAYRSGSELVDERTGTVHDYRRKGGVVHSEIVAPVGAPQWATERARLWNEVETTEKRKDAQLAREIELALPRELTTAQQIELVRQFVREQFVDAGMVADVAIHDPLASDGQRQPHAHVMLTTRQIGPERFGPKAREWNDKEKLGAWREQWAAHVNRALERAGVDQRVDHRRLEVQQREAERDAAQARQIGQVDRAEQADRRYQDLDREPQPKLGKTARAMERRGERSGRGDIWRAAMARNAERQSLWRMVRAWGNQIRDQIRDPIMRKLEEVKDQAAAAKQDLAAKLRQADTTRLKDALNRRRSPNSRPTRISRPPRGGGLPDSYRPQRRSCVVGLMAFNVLTQGSVDTGLVARSLALEPIQHVGVKAHGDRLLERAARAEQRPTDATGRKLCVRHRGALGIGLVNIGVRPGGQGFKLGLQLGRQRLGVTLPHRLSFHAALPCGR